MAAKLLSARQAAAMLGVSKAYACRLFANGAIPAQKVDTDWVVQEKDVRSYLDDKADVPQYYRDTEGWDRGDYYFLYRVLDRMAQNRRGRYDEEIAAIQPERLSDAARAILVALGAPAKFDSLKGVGFEGALSPAILLTDHPSMGAFPAFEKVGLIL